MPTCYYYAFQLRTVNSYDGGDVIVTLLGKGQHPEVEEVEEQEQQTLPEVVEVFESMSQEVGGDGGAVSLLQVELLQSWGIEREQEDWETLKRNQDNYNLMQQDAERPVDLWRQQMEGMRTRSAYLG